MRMVSRLLYTEEEICRLLEAARNLVTPHKLQPWTYYCLFGLLAVSGMRLGEALNLQPQDANWSESLLTIRDAKFGKSRVVPLHSSTLEVLFAYAERRDKFTRRIGCPTSSYRAMERDCSPLTPVKYSGIYRGRLESVSRELVMGRACMTSGTDSQWRRC
jgi:integrase